MNRICLLRLSALGDVTHVLSVVRRLQDRHPDWALCWIIGRLERRLMADLEGVELIEFNKSEGLGAYRKLRRTLRGRRFDALLHLQVALRANLASALVPAARRIGYDRQRARDGHGLFVNERIEAGSGQHVLDAMHSFLDVLGVGPAPLRWDLPLSDADRAFARQHLAEAQPVLCVSPVSSHKLRNWSVSGYARVADHAASRYGMQVILTGGPTRFERDFNAAIASAMTQPALDLTGKDTLKQLAALLAGADLLLAPDTGPMHIANAMGTDVLGLHAASNPRRSGPYHSLRWCVDAYDAAARKFLAKPAEQLPWGTKIEYEGVMDLVQIDAALQKLDEWAASRLG